MAEPTSARTTGSTGCISGVAELGRATIAAN